MARFFFHSVNGGQHLDREGAEFPTLGAARIAATAYLAELLREGPEAFWQEGQLQVVVTDAAGVALSILTLTGAQTLPGGAAGRRMIADPKTRARSLSRLAAQGAALHE